MSTINNITKSFFPANDCLHPTDTLIEYLRIWPTGKLGVRHGLRSHDIASYFTGGIFRSHYKADFTSAQFRLSRGSWYETRAIFEGRPVDLLYQLHGRSPNPHVTSMVRFAEPMNRQPVELGPDECARGEGLVIFDRWTKPYADIASMDILDLKDEVNEIVTGWWHAVPTETGWRVFADDLNGLFYVRMALPRRK